MKLIDSTLTELQHALDVRLRRHEVLSANIANADTPGYAAKDLDFEGAMALARQRDAPGGPTLPLPAQQHPAAGAPLPGEGRTWLQVQPPPPPAVGAPSPPPGSQPGAVVPLAGTSPGLDGNSVDLDRTMVAMSENALLYGAATKAVSKKLAILRYVASDGVG